MLWQGFPFVSEAYYIAEETAVYRLNENGVTFSKGKFRMNVKLYIDSGIIGYYYSAKRNDREDMLKYKRSILGNRITCAIEGDGGNTNVAAIISNPVFRDIINQRRKFWYLYRMICLMGIRCEVSTFQRWIGRIRSPITSLIHLLMRCRKRK